MSGKPANSGGRADRREARLMTYDPDRHHRRSIRLAGYDYSKAGAYFVAICAQNRECLFGDVADGAMRMNGAGRMVEMAWNELPTRFPNTELDAFVVMPNHIHGIIVFVGAGLALPLNALPIGMGAAYSMGAANSAPTNPPTHGDGAGANTLGNVIGAFKSLASLRINRLLHRTGAVWQRNYFEHIIRDGDSMNRIQEYIANNPLRWTQDRENPATVPQPRFTPIKHTDMEFPC